jgi:flagellar basal-body rod protein FlgB
VSSVYLFDLAARQSQFLSVRQATIADNVANANTPAYRAKEVGAFAEILDRTQLALAATNAGHIRSGGVDLATADVHEMRGGQVSASGNSVSLEDEMMKASEVNRDYALNTSVVKSFHRMLMMCVKV